MKEQIYIPNSKREAGLQIRLALARPLQRLRKRKFLRAWCSIAYLFPGLHPDGYEDADNGWPPVLKRFADEAWRRAGNGRLTDAELYPSDPQWCGLYDRMHTHKQDEMDRRFALAADYGESLHA